MIVHPYDDIEAFALGGLDSAASTRVLEHADECPACAVLLADAMRIAHVMEQASHRPLASSALGRLLIVRSRPRVAAWTAALGAAAAILALLVWNLDLRSSLPLVPIASLVHSHFLHHGLHGVAGSAKVLQAVDGRWLYLVADGLTPRAQYEFFETAGGARREVGEFTSDATGRATAYWEQAPRTIRSFSIGPAASSDPNRELRWP